MIKSHVEEATLAWLAELGCDVAYGPDVEPEKLAAERDDFSEVVLSRRLRAALERINPQLPGSAIDDAMKKVLVADSPSLIENNHRFHRLLVDGIDVEYTRRDGSIAGDKAWLVDFDDVDANHWLAINQFTVMEGKATKRPDVVVFVNGLPLAVIELKNPADVNATTKKAFQQLQTYKHVIPSLFTCNELLVASDGLDARHGTLTAPWERFMPWRTVDGTQVAPKGAPELPTLVRGIFEKRRFLDLIRYFNVYEVDGPTIAKKMAAYHQYWAVNKAVEATVEAVTGDHRVGVVWHTQGSGKSLSMAFYSGKLVQQPEMAEPDAGRPHRPQRPGRPALRDVRRLSRATAPEAGAGREPRRPAGKLQVASGGVVFTTIQKFMPDERGETHPLLSDRANIVVIADEAHRSQYDFIDGFARHLRDALPNASFIGFTGTPIELTDKNTRAVFGDYIDTYDIQRAVEDGATVPIYYEGRLAKIDLPEDQKPVVDAEFDEVTEATEVAAPREAQEQVGAHRGDGGHRASPRTRGQGPGRPLRGAPGRRPGHADEGHGRVHEPAHLRRPVRRDREATPGLARRGGRRRRR